MFGGNAMLALDWLDFMREFPDRSAGFLFVEYPGYGSCEGSPNPARILETSEKAFHALQDRKHWSFGPESIGVVGWSRGAAAAVQFADKQPVGQVILVAPFTTMSDMVKRYIGLPPGPLLFHPFDNVGALRRILVRKPAPKVTIVHGRADTLVPISMGRTLAMLDPQHIRFVEISSAGHNNVFYQAQSLVFADMASP
jgi:pimeloyl-ACP methyl ester carboxylesterase